MVCAQSKNIIVYIIYVCLQLKHLASLNTATTRFNHKSLLLSCFGITSFLLIPFVKHDVLGDFFPDWKLI